MIVKLGYNKRIKLQLLVPNDPFFVHNFTVITNNNYIDKMLQVLSMFVVTELDSMFLLNLNCLSLAILYRDSIAIPLF